MSVALFGCHTSAPKQQLASTSDTYEIAFETVVSAVVPTLQALEIEVLRHSIDSTTASYEAVARAGARILVEVEFVVPGRTFVQVRAGKMYGGNLASLVRGAILARASNAG